MKDDLDLIHSVRKVLEAVGVGSGLARSIVVELRDDSDLDRAARAILLGYPVDASMELLAEGRSPEIAMLASLVAEAGRSSATLVGQRSGAVSGLVERWAKMRKNGEMEMKAQQFRGTLASAVMGGVTAMITSLGPLLSNFGPTLQTSIEPSPWLAIVGGCLVLVSAGMLGLFLSGGKFYVNMAASLFTFVIVGLAMAPLASPWGVGR